MIQVNVEKGLTPEKLIPSKPESFTLKNPDRPSADQSRISSSVYSNLPSSNLTNSAIGAIIGLLIVNAIVVINLIYSLGTYGRLQRYFENSEALSILSSSVFIKLTASNVFVLSRAGFSSPAIEAGYEELLRNVDKRILLRKRLDNSLEVADKQRLLCGTSSPDVEKAILLARGLKADPPVFLRCTSALTGGLDYNWLQALNELLIYFERTTQDAEFSGANDPHTYFTSAAYAQQDTKAFYLTIAIRLIAAKYQGFIGQNITEVRGTTYTFVWLFVVLLGGFALFFRCALVRVAVRQWNDTAAIFGVMNDQTLNNVYVKSLFGKTSSASPYL